jgi:hypothetical protein
MQAYRPFEVMQDAVERVQRCERVLKHHLYLRPVLGHRTATRARLLTIEQDSAARRRLELHQHPRDGRLARPGLPDERNRLTRFEREGNILDGLKRGAFESRAQGEVLHQIPRFQCGRVHRISSWLG